MMSLLPRRVMLRRWFFSLRLPSPVLVIDFLDRHSEKLHKGSSNFFLNVHRGQQYGGQLIRICPFANISSRFQKCMKLSTWLMKSCEIFMDSFRKIDEDV